MARDNSQSNKDRREFLRLTGLASTGGLVGLAGCSGTGGGGETGTPTATEGDGSTPTSTATPTPSGPQTPETPTGEIVVAQTYDPNTLDPAKFSSVTDQQIANNIFDALVNYKLGTSEIGPGLAKDWTFSNDGKSLTLTLREGVKFHKGYGEFTSEDVKFHFDRLQNEGSPQKTKLKQMSFEGLEVNGDYEVTLNFGAPASVAPFELGRIMGMIPSKKAVQEKGKDFAFDPVGTGPFKFDAYQPKTHTKLTAFEDYWREAWPNSARATFKPIPESQTAWSSFNAGDIHLKRVNSSTRYQQLKQDDSVKFSEAVGLITRFIGFNTQVEPFTDRKVRRALNYAANKKAIVDEVFKGITVGADSFMAPDVKYHTTDGVPSFKHDPEKAQSLLSEAGYGDGFETTFWVPNIGRFTKPAKVFQNNWSQIGVDINMKIKEVGSYISTIIGGEHEIPIFTHSLGQSPVPDTFMFSTFHSSSFPPGNNWWLYEDDQVDSWLEEVTSTVDEQRRAELFAKIQRRTAADAPGIWIDHEKFVFASQDSVHGFQSDPQRRIELDTAWVSQ